MKPIRALRAFAATAFVAAAAGAQTPVSKDAPPSYHVVKRIKVGGDGGWDYLTVDTARNRLFLSRSTHVMVVDLARDSVVGDILDTPGVHGVALAYELGRGFTSNGRDSTVTVFDLKTLAPIQRVKVTGRNPDAIFYEPLSKRVFTFNGGSADATVIDATSLAVVGTIPLGGKPEAAVSDGKRVMVNIEDTGEIVAFDPRTLAVLSRWPLAPCEDPTGLAYDRTRNRLFASCGNSRMAVVDATSGKIVAMLPIGPGADGAAFDPASGLAASTNGGDGTVTLVRGDGSDHYVVVGSVPTQRGARTVAYDPRTRRIYTVSADYGPPPEATPDRPRPRPPLIPGTFTILVLER